MRASRCASISSIHDSESAELLSFQAVTFFRHGHEQNFNSIFRAF